MKVDIGFLLDSSKSLQPNYKRLKNFLLTLADTFDINYYDSRAAVITFSWYAKHSIRLRDHANMASFKSAVDDIPLLGSTTRIDRPLRLAEKKMFRPTNGARSGVAKILVILTDGGGSDTITRYTTSEDPVDIADSLRNEGITLVVIGLGPSVDTVALNKIAGGRDKAIFVSDFQDLVDKEFVTSVKKKLCQGKVLIELVIFLPIT